MLKSYSENSSNYRMEATNETIRFLLDFSKSLRIVKSKTNKIIEFNLN